LKNHEARPSFVAIGVQMHNRCRPLAAVAFVLVCWQAAPVRAQEAGMARLGAFPVAPVADVGGPVSSPAISPTLVPPAAHQDSSGARSNVRRHVVVGAVLGMAAGLALASFEYRHYADRSAQSDCQSCAIIVVVGVPVVGLTSLLGGYLGWRSADHPHPTTPN
jgi:hypothetical protein